MASHGLRPTTALPHKTKVLGGLLAPPEQRLSVDSASHFDGHVASLKKRLSWTLVAFVVLTALLIGGFILGFIIINNTANDNSQILLNLQAHVAGLLPSETEALTYTLAPSTLVDGEASWFNVSKAPAASPDQVSYLSFPPLASSNGTVMQAAAATLDSTATTAYGTNAKPVTLPSLPSDFYLVTGQVQVKTVIPRPAGGSDTPGSMELDTVLVLFAGSSVVASSRTAELRYLEYTTGFDTITYVETLRFCQVVRIVGTTGQLRVGIRGTKSGTTLTFDSHDFVMARTIVGDAASTFFTVLPLPHYQPVIT